jgi:DegV family protein with EDD domain
MANAAIMTDTIACLPPDLVSKYGIKLLPVSYNIDGTAYRDGIDLTPDEFWKLFPKMKEFTTGAPPLSEYTSLFAEMARTTDKIVCVFVSKALSAVNETAVQAANLFRQDHPDVDITVLDSRTAAGAEAFMVEEMAKAAAAGKSAAEIAAVAAETRKHVKFVTVMETLKYLIKSGRAPKTAYMGELFQVKPIIGMLGDSGEVENLGRARGKEKAIARMLDLMQEQFPEGQAIRVYVHYTDSREAGEALKELVLKRFNCAETYFTPYTPVMSGHTGPVLAVSFYC